MEFQLLLINHTFYSRGNKYDKGNRNIKLVSIDRVLIKHHDGSWIEGYVNFKDRYHSLLNELINLASVKKGRVWC